ncbi:BTAD domain-containing putative transcriptional regulator [Actinoplanes sp. NPDC000266]
MGNVHIGLLGDVTVWTADGTLEIPSHQQRMTLSCLALNAGQMVSTQHIVKALWDDEPPPSARTTVRGYIRRLRSTLRSGAVPPFDVIASCPGGYRLRADPTDVDLSAFRLWRAEAAATSSRTREASLLDQCLALWRGRPLAGLDGAPWVDLTATALEEDILQTAERRCDLLMADREFGSAVAYTQRLIAHHPLRESLWRRLLESLHEAGRTAEALVLYQSMRRQLIDALGVEPSAETREVHRLLLRADQPRTTAGPRRSHTPV